MEINDVGLQVLLVFLPCHFINSDRCVLLQIEERLSQTVFVDVMSQGSELERAVLAGRFTHALQSA